VFAYEEGVPVMRFASRSLTCSTLVTATATGAVSKLEHRCSRSFMSQELHLICLAAN
jgi:hypothetical protein